MSFTDTQVRKLRARVRPQYVKERELDGKTLHYLEGWHLIAEANRIFGFDAWDRETVSSQCVWQKQIDHRFAAAYLTRVRVSVRAGERVIVREGLGSGEAIGGTPGQAHERASKAAETDATKRALSTFGNSFGLSLYKGSLEPAKPVRGRKEAASPITPAASASGSVDKTGKEAATTALSEPPQDHSAPPADLTAQPIQEAQAISGRDKPDETQAAMPAAGQSEVDQPQRGIVALPVYMPPGVTGPAGRIDKSALALPEPKRRRDREHLRFVARQPCLVCARTPSQAHHLRIAQPRALGRKVSDEFTVPLCALHHHDLHHKGNEALWWQDKNIDPMPVADELWSASQGLPRGRLIPQPP